MDENENIHPLVMATIESHRARNELKLEQLRSARAACTTATTGGQSRALSLGKRIRETEALVASWRLAVATLAAETYGMTEAAQSATESLKALGEALAPESTSQDPARVVGSLSTCGRALRCFPCTLKAREDYPEHSGSIRDVTSEDLPDGGMCADCGSDVLA